MAESTHRVVVCGHLGSRPAGNSGGGSVPWGPGIVAERKGGGKPAAGRARVEQNEDGTFYTRYAAAAKTQRRRLPVLPVLLNAPDRAQV
jgi:hypothetical protein